MGVGVQVENLNAWYGKGQALYDINLKVAANHATALIGPSGCGKSTFIRCINRMHETIPDRKSTRLNSSHLGISYAVFCLKKKKTALTHTPLRILAQRAARLRQPRRAE